MTRGYQGKCQICGVFGHSVKRCSQLQQPQYGTQNSLLPSPFQPWQPRANLALGHQYPANPWLLDSGATHHMTSDLANLSLHQPYQGEDAVLIGDGLLFLSLILVHHLYPLPLKIYYYPMSYVYPIFTKKSYLCLSVM